MRIDVTGQPNAGMYHWVHLKYRPNGVQNVHMLPHPNPASPQFIGSLVPDNLPDCTSGESIP